MHIADVLLPDVGMRGLPCPRRLVLVAEQEADCRSERRQVGGIGQQAPGSALDNGLRPGWPASGAEMRDLRHPRK